MMQQFSATLLPQGTPGGPPGPQGPQGDPATQTPWAQDIDAAGHQLNNAGGIHVNGDVDITGHYYRNGVQLSISTQNVVTASRAANTVYQNTTGKTMFLSVCWNLVGTAATLSLLSDSSNPPTTTVAQIADASPQSFTGQLFCLVLPGNYYECSVSVSGLALVSWVEYE